MKFNSILSKYVEENNLKNSILTEDEMFEEAKQKTEVLYATMVVAQTEFKFTEEMVKDLPFYGKKAGKSGVNLKSNQDEETTKSAIKEQIKLYNECLSLIREKSIDGKLTHVQFFGTCLDVFTKNGQNTATAGYNTRVLFNLLRDKSHNIIRPDSTSGEEQIGNIKDLIPPKEPVAQETGETLKPVTSTLSKFDKALDDNKPTASVTDNTDAVGSEDNYFKVDKNARVEKTDDPDREYRIAANYLLDTIKEELPGFFNKQTLADRAKEEDSGMSDKEISDTINKLVKAGKISLVPKGTEEDAVPDRVDSEDSAASRPNIEDPKDFIDKQLTGSTRKGFSSSDYNFDF